MYTREYYTNCLTFLSLWWMKSRERAKNMMIVVIIIMRCFALGYFPYVFNRFQNVLWQKPLNSKVANFSAIIHNQRSYTLSYQNTLREVTVSLATKKTPQLFSVKMVTKQRIKDVILTRDTLDKIVYCCCCFALFLVIFLKDTVKFMFHCLFFVFFILGSLLTIQASCHWISCAILFS